MSKNTELPTDLEGAYQHLSLRIQRKRQLLKALTNEEPQDEKEKQVVSRYGGPNADQVRRQALILHRVHKIKAWLRGDTDAIIEVKPLEKSGETTAPGPADSTISGRNHE